MFDISVQTSNKAGSISVITSSLSTHVLTRFHIRHKREKRRKRTALLYSVSFHLVLFLILLFALPRQTPLNLHLIDAANAITIFSLFPVEKPPDSETDSSNMTHKHYNRQNMFRPKIDNNILALTKIFVPQTDKWDKQANTERQDHRQVELTKKVTYQQRLTYADPVTAIRKKIFYEDKTTIISRKDEAEVIISVNLPVENKATDRIFILSGRIHPDAKSAFITVNDNTQSLKLYSDEYFVIMTNLKRGLNKFSIVALTHQGKMGVKTFKLLYSPPINQPIVVLYSPENGQQGIEAGETVLVKGITNDQSITEATLYLNKIPIDLEVKKGEFTREIQAPDNKINTFQVRVLGKKGVYGYSAQHTVLTGYGYEIPVVLNENPRPY